MNSAQFLTMDHFLCSLQGMFQLFVNVIDRDVSYHDLIANIRINLILNPNASFTSLGKYGTGNGGSITLQFKVTCNTNYYGHTCTHCTDTDDNTGHFTCGSNGEKLCLTGWSGPTGNCTSRKLNFLSFAWRAVGQLFDLYRTASAPARCFSASKFYYTISMGKAHLCRCFGLLKAFFRLMHVRRYNPEEDLN